MKKGKIYDLILVVLTVGCILLLWCVSAHIIDNEYLLPTVYDTLKALLNLFKSGEFYLSVLLTVLRSVVAFVLSFVLAFSLAVWGNTNKTAKRIIKIIVSITRALPTIAVVLLLLFWTNSQIAPVIVTMLVVFPTVFTNIENALSEIDKDQIEMCKVFNVDSKTVLKKVKIPQIAPSLIRTVGSGLSLNLKLMVAAEVLSQTAKSLGFMLNTSKAYFEISTMIALVVVSVVLGLITESVFSLLSEKAGKWK